MICLKVRILNTIKKYNMIQPDEKIILAVSGGPDSTALLYLMYNLRDELKCSLHIAHLNHNLRGEESDADAEFVKEQAQKLDLPITVESLDVKSMISKESLESGARRIRYQFYEKVMSETHANKVVLGHTTDDQAETVIMRFLRGSGMKGLSGIPPVRDDIYIRPLIETSRAEVEEYLQSLNITPRWDSSNLSTEYERNKIRYELIPLLELNYSPNIKHILQQTADILREEDDFLTEQIQQAMGECINHQDSRSIDISIPDLKKHHIALQRRILRLAIESLLGDLNRYDFDHLASLIDLIDNNTGKIISLPRGIIAERVYDKIIIGLESFQQSSEPFDYIIGIPDEIEIPDLKLSIRTVLSKSDDMAYSKDKFQKTFDYDEIKGNLHLRNRRNGDRFQPLGVSGTKKLKDFFIDKKVPRSQRDNIPILTDGNNILWIVGYQIDDRFKVTTKTKTELNVTVRIK
jgi:tRNA(Ile)-lysidine synthase